MATSKEYIRFILDQLSGLFEAIYEELPDPKKKRRESKHGI